MRLDYDIIQLPRILNENFEDILNKLIVNDITHVSLTRDNELKFWSIHKKNFRKKNIQVIISFRVS